MEAGGAGGGHCLTFASCLVRKSTKPNPLCAPVPVIFFGKRTVFSSPKVLGTIGRSQVLRTEGWKAVGVRVGGRTDSHMLIMVTGEWVLMVCQLPHQDVLRGMSGLPLPALAATLGRKGMIRLEILM